MKISKQKNSVRLSIILFLLKKSNSIRKLRVLCKENKWDGGVSRRAPGRLAPPCRRCPRRRLRHRRRRHDSKGQGAEKSDIASLERVICLASMRLLASISTSHYEITSLAAIVILYSLSRGWIHSNLILLMLIDISERITYRSSANRVSRYQNVRANRTIEKLNLWKINIIHKIDNETLYKL